MITIVDAIRALSTLIETLFGEPPTTNDITEGFVVPCTYIRPNYMSTSAEGEIRHDTYEIEIVRMAEHTRQGYLSLLEWEAKLALALQDPVMVEDEFFLYPDDVGFEIEREDMLLRATLTVETYQPRDAEQAPYMEDLTLSRKDG